MIASYGKLMKLDVFEYFKSQKSTFPQVNKNGLILHLLSSEAQK